MTVGELLAHAPAYVDPVGARGIDAVVDLVVDDERHQLVLRDAVLTVTRDGPETAALTVRTSADDLLGMVEGRRRPMELYATRRLTAEGDLLLALRLRKAFRTTVT